MPTLIPVSRLQTFLGRDALVRQIPSNLYLSVAPSAEVTMKELSHIDNELFVVTLHNKPLFACSKQPIKVEFHESSNTLAITVVEVE